MWKMKALFLPCLSPVLTQGRQLRLWKRINKCGLFLPQRIHQGSGFPFNFPKHVDFGGNEVFPRLKRTCYIATAKKVSSETAVCVTVIGREVSGGSILGQEQAPVCGRSRAQSPPRLPDGGPQTQPTVLLCAPGSQD